MIRWKLIMLRKQAKITQEEMAKRLNISSVSYRAKENGRREFTEKEIEKIIASFDKDANYFLESNIGKS